MRHNRPYITKDAPGRRLRQKLGLQAIVHALVRNTRPRTTLAFEPLAAEGDPCRLREDDRDPAPLEPAHAVDGMRAVRAFGVATGQSIYPTPLGQFSIVVKWGNPWWYPPNSAWAKGEKPVPPGPGNPLGTRWMGLSAPGVGIHGTPDDASIGYSARTAASACTFPRRSGSSTTSTSGPRSTSSPPRPVARALKLAAQGARGARRRRAARPPRLEGRAPGRRRLREAEAGRPARRRGSRSTALGARRQADASPRCRGKAGRPQLLGVLVRPVQEGGADAGGRVAAAEAGGRRRRRASTGRTSAATRSASCSKHGVTYPSSRDELRARRRLVRRAPACRRRSSSTAAGARRRARRGRGHRERPGRRASRRRSRREARGRPWLLRWRWCSRARRRAASEQHPTLAELEAQVMCPICKTTLDQSDSPAAKRIEAFISQQIAAGDTRSEIKAEARRSSSAPAILAAPPRSGFDLLAWWLPIAACSRGGAVARRRRVALEPRRASGSPRRPRDRGRAARSGARAPARRGARPLRLIVSGIRSRSSPGFVVVAHAVRAAARARLPLGGVRGRRPGGSASGRRRGASSSRASRSSPASRRLRRPRRRRGAVGGVARRRALQTRSPASSSSSSASPSSGLLPWPERLVAPGLLAGARRRGSRVLLGAAFARLRRAVHRPGARGRSSCSRAARRRSLARLGPARRVLARARRCRSCSPASRSRARWARSAGCATTTGDPGRRAAPMLVALGLLLFFDRDWWLRVGAEPRPRSRSGSAPRRRARARASPPRRRRGRVDLDEHARDVDAAVPGAYGPSRRSAFVELALAADSVPRPAWYHATATWTSPWRKSRSAGGGGAPRVLELLVRREELARRISSTRRSRRDAADCARSSRRALRSRPVATILLAGSTSSSGGSSRASSPDITSITADSVDPPDLVIADIARIEPRRSRTLSGRPDPRIHESHRHRRPAPRAHRRLRPGGGQIALVERARELVEELLAPVE